MDISKNEQLTGLECSKNKLTKLNIGNNKELYYLHCGNNSLTSINISKCTNLVQFYCNNNKLEKLDVRKIDLMTIRKTEIGELDGITDIVQSSIREIYPKYYLQEVVDFFLEHHAKEKIETDILAGNVLSLYEDEVLVGTGSREDEHVTRVYVLPEYQGRGCGSYIMDCLETKISKDYDRAVLDASLPAVLLYERRGYRTVRHQSYVVENGVVLVYGVMEKLLH